ncbi:MAG: lycopene beta-cyclase CrtY [Candidatus Hydrogenedentes bacterium]|nr:lycopene beta-cyclase CrtY [Candidatus Hydrogenedentota bacterium]
MANPAVHTFNHLLVGGGLQNGLIAWLLLKRDPEARVALIEAGDCLGGNHTWSYHASDVPESHAWELRPLAQYSWDTYQVHFPRFIRELRLGYRSLHSSHLNRLLLHQFQRSSQARLILSTRATEVRSDRVVLETGEVLHGRSVIDARGPVLDDTPRAATGYQKFVGLELRLGAPGRARVPILMDACVPQEDGFRFFYVLPYGPDRVLIEDTRFSDNPDLDVAALEASVLAYAAERRYDVKSIIRKESGVLPMPWTARTDWPNAMPMVAGYGGGFIHPATGYSFPVALRVALHVANAAPGNPLGPAWADLLTGHQRQYRFAAFLNRLLFTAYEPQDRFHIFKRFYHQPEETIARFYRLSLERADMARMFTGRPPKGFSVKRMVKGALHR